MTDPGKTLISVVGPTALGKTRLAIALARHYDTEIISSDSRQFYREMRIGTAVPSPEELKAVRHHFIQQRSIFEPYTVGDFEREALERLRELFKKHPVVVMAGGSGLYINAVTQGLDDFPKLSPNIRKVLKDRLETEGIQALQRQLEELDPAHYAVIDLQNPQRLVRALEVCIGTGQPYSSFLQRKGPERPFRTLTVGLMADRDVLYERINLRVDQMLSDGLLEEARALYPHRQLNALQTVGYKELFDYFDEKQDLETAISEIKKNTRRFAKRQLTWFRKQAGILWVDYREPPDAIIGKLDKILYEKP